MSGIECILRGDAICKVKFNFTTRIVSTKIETKGVRYDDWQCDGGFHHNEGWIDYDLSNAKIIHKDEYIVIDCDGKTHEGKMEIIELLEVIAYNLDECEV